MNLQTLQYIAYVWLLLAIAVHIIMFFITAPFGRHTSDRWGMMINNKLGWFIMELTSFLIMAYFLIFGTYSFTSYVWILFALWLFHYFNRTFIYPLRIRKTPKKIPLFIVGNGVLFNLVNAGLNGYYLAELAPISDYSEAWFTKANFWVGLFLFVAGMYINWKADNILIHLRKPGESGYKIPRGFLFEKISSPNLFGEIIEWTGFAIMAWNLPAFSFMVWTMANLVPRAKNHHDWYVKNFPEYPKERKIVFPYLF